MIIEEYRTAYDTGSNLALDDVIVWIYYGIYQRYNKYNACRFCCGT